MFTYHHETCLELVCFYYHTFLGRVQIFSDADFLVWHDRMCYRRLSHYLKLLTYQNPFSLPDFRKIDRKFVPKHTRSKYVLEVWGERTRAFDPLILIFLTRCPCFKTCVPRFKLVLDIANIKYSDKVSSRLSDKWCF